MKHTKWMTIVALGVGLICANVYAAGREEARLSGEETRAWAIVDPIAVLSASPELSRKLDYFARKFVATVRAEGPYNRDNLRRILLIDVQGTERLVVRYRLDVIPAVSTFLRDVRSHVERGEFAAAAAFVEKYQQRLEATGAVDCSFEHRWSCL